MSQIKCINLLLLIFKFSSVIVHLSELILAELSSASESVQPGLIDLGQLGSKSEFDLAHVKYSI